MKLTLFLIPLLALISGQLIAQQNYLVGKTSIPELFENEPIFEVYTNRYQPDSAAVQFLAQYPDTISIIVLFGTWCHDSKREVPALIKTIQTADNSNIKSEFIGVDRGKNDPENISNHWGLKYTPTFIIVGAGNEIGRIVEESTLGIEVDLKNILSTGNLKDL